MAAQPAIERLDRRLGQRLDQGDWIWVLTVAACSLFVAILMIAWSQLRGY